MTVKKKIESYLRKIENYFNKNSFYQQYFDSVKNNQIKKYHSPFYTHGYIIKQWDPNITDYKLYDKKNSLNELINNFTTLTNILDNGRQIHYLEHHMKKRKR